jgi:hypothetical protein
MSDVGEQSMIRAIPSPAQSAVQTAASTIL